MVAVQLEKNHGLSGTVLIEPLLDEWSMGTDLHLGCCVVDLAGDKPFQVLLTGFTQQVGTESWNGFACEVTPVCATTQTQDPALVKNVNSIDSEEIEHRRKLLRGMLVEDSDSPLTCKEKDELVEVAVM